MKVRKVIEMVDNSFFVFLGILLGGCVFNSFIGYRKIFLLKF